ncbi:MAG: choloylglycine hydrolase [Clostridia bacterium]|nr:choloylglycine hydrolase [Clostridia bacterium]
MCTSIAKQLETFFFGRNMDLSCGFGQEVVIMPRAYPLRFRCAGKLAAHYALIGMARVEDGYPLYADAGNDLGLCMAGLNFPQSAHYDVEQSPDMENVSPFELIPWVLGQCASVDEAEALLRRTHLTAIPFSDTVGLSPLHWHIADAKRSIAVEPMSGGLCIRENPVGVMTNEPPFDFHLTNLRQYLRLTPEQPVSAFPGGSLTPFGWGFGALGMPGDASPASRFVRAAFHAACSPAEGGPGQFFHLLDAVAMPRGSVRDDRGCEFTLYSSCIDPSAGVYYYRTYDNSRITAVPMGDPDGSSLRRYPLHQEEDILWT